MDLAACIFLTISCAMSFPGAPSNYLGLGSIGNDLVCFLFRNRVLTLLCMNAEKFGLAEKSAGPLVSCISWELSGASCYEKREFGMVLYIKYVTIGLDCSAGAWYERRKDRSCGHHARALLQDRSPQILSQLDDSSGRGHAMDCRNMHVWNPSYCDVKICARKLPADGCLAKQRL